MYYRADSKSPLILKLNSHNKNNAVKEIKQTEFPNYFQRESKWVDSFAEIVNKAIKEAFGDFLTKWEKSLSQLIGFTKEEVNPLLEKPTGHSVFTALIYLFGIYQLQSYLCP